MIAIKSVNDMIARKRIEEKNGVLYVHVHMGNEIGKCIMCMTEKNPVAVRSYFWENVNQI